MSNPASAVPGAPSTSLSTTISVPRLSARSVLPWLILAALMFVVAVYFIAAEQGATALFGGNAIHEWTHDGRHLLGFPCH